MKTWTSILAAGLILAFAATAANAARASVPGNPVGGTVTVQRGDQPDVIVKVLLNSKQQAATIKALQTKNKALQAKNKALAAKNKALKDRGPLVIYVDRSTWPPYTPTPSNECQTSGNDCTPEDYCAIWGMNCDQVTSTGSTSTTEAPPPSDSGQGVETAPLAPVSAPLPCASLTDPAISQDYLDAYDWSC